MKKNITFVVELDVSFHSYEDEKLDKKAAKEIEKWIRQTANNNLRYIPMWVEQDDYGSFIEDCTTNTKVKIRRKK